MSLMKLLLVLVCVFVATVAADLRSFSAEKVLDLLRNWNLEDEFASVFKGKGYDGYALDIMTKEDIDKEFPNSSPLHKRSLYSRIQELKNPHGVSRKLQEKTGPKPAAYFKDYTGVNMNQDKSYITFGENEDIKIYRDEKGALHFEASAIYVNGKLLAPAPAPDVNECLKNNGGCHSKRKCINTPGSMKCGDCSAGYVNDGAKGCKDIDECLKNNGGCHSKRKCMNTVGSMKCGDCSAGYDNDGAKGCKDTRFQVLDGAATIPSSWLKESGKTRLGTLLYRASRDGWNSKSNFHPRCDDKGATLTVIRHPKGYIFGGYTEQSWKPKKAVGNWNTDTKAWLFWLKCHHLLPPKKTPVTNPYRIWATFSSNPYGPTFGSGHDLMLSEDLHTGYVNWGRSYKLPAGKDNSFLTGIGKSYSQKMANEVEVYQVV